MAKQILNIGAAPNDGNGDPLRDAMDKVNDNFNELYTALGGNTVSTIISNGLIDYTGANKLTFLFTDISDLPAASSYHGMFAHAHNQGAAYFAHAGSWIELANKSELSNITIGSLIDVDTTSSAPTDGQVLKWNNAGSKWVPADDSNDGSVALTDLSVTVASAGTANLAYNANTGAFTYTPPDLSGYQLTSNAFDGDYNSLTNKPTIPSALTDLGITDGTTGQVLKTDGAGNFTFGTITTGSSYGDSDVDTHLNTSTATANQILAYDGSDYAWIAQPGGGAGIALTDLSVTTASASGTPSLAYNNTSGVFTYTPPDLANAIVLQSQYTTTVTTNAADPTSTDNHVLGNTGTPSVHNASTAWYYGDVVSDPANPTTSVVLDIDSGILTGDVIGDITSAGTSTFSGTVDFSSSSNVDFTGATVSGLSATNSFDDVLSVGDTTNRAVTINNTLTVDAIDSTGIGFANLTSASDIVLNATGDINASSSKITNVLDPTAAQDAATKTYVDTAIADQVPTFSVTAPDSGRYQFNGAGTDADDNPTLYLYRGFTYHLNINSPGHPFHIQTSSGAYNASNLYTDNVTNGGTQSGTITWTVQMDSPNTLYYVCQYHSAMNGVINIV